MVPFSTQRYTLFVVAYESVMLFFQLPACQTTDMLKSIMALYSRPCQNIFNNSMIGLSSEVHYVQHTVIKLE